MLLPDQGTTLGELVGTVVAFREGPQVGEETDGVVVLAGSAGGDHPVNACPGGFFVIGQFVQSSFAGQGLSTFAAGLLRGSS